MAATAGLSLAAADNDAAGTTGTLTGLAAGLVNGCSRAIRTMVPSGSASQGILSSSTIGKCGLAWTPLYSSARMISTTALIEPDQMSAGTRIQSLPRLMA